MVATLEQVEAGPDRVRADRAFEHWGVGAYLVAIGVLVAGIVVHLGGRLVYTLDDAAIHLSIAQKLVDHGTWGVVPGSFESASSSPLWTLFVAAGMVVTPGSGSWLPLVLNVLASVAVIVVLGRNQSVLRPGRDRPFDAVAVVVLVVVVLFLPGLAVSGMEHALHIALVLGAVVLFQRRAVDAGDTAGFPRWLPFVLLGLATLARFETAFVAAGLALGLLAELPRSPAGRRARVREVVGVGAAVAVPLAGFSLFNVVMGGGLLPNSVLAKGQGVGGQLDNDGFGIVDVIQRLGQDPLLVALGAFALGYVILTWGRPARYRMTAVTVTVAIALHVVLADVGWFERYQAYLIALGVYLALGVVAELPAGVRRRGLVALVVVAALLTPTKAALLVRTPRYADQMYRHQYVAGQFLDRYYGGEPIATDQLGYISLFHRGPLTDFAGLGDYEVLRRAERTSDEAGLRGELAEERGFRVAVLPQVAALFGVPKTWVLVGTFRIDGPYDGVSRDFQWFATTPDEVHALREHLLEYEPQLPARTTLVMNDLAEFQAAQLSNPTPQLRPR
jgi:hypothetical protein